MCRAIGRDALLPYGVSLCEGTLVIADSGNNRVVIRTIRDEELE